MQSNVVQAAEEKRGKMYCLKWNDVSSKYSYDYHVLAPGITSLSFL